MIIGIDQSKRSTAAVCISDTGKLADFLLINPHKDIDNEHLLVYQWDQLDMFIASYAKYLDGIALEGLSFNAVGSGKDMLAGVFWYIRTSIYINYPTVPVGIIPVTSWRNKLIDIEERRALKKLGTKFNLKDLTVAKLPFEIRAKFEQYISGRGIKKEALYDLADAYFIAQYRLSLEQ